MRSYCLLLSNVPRLRPRPSLLNWMSSRTVVQYQALQATKMGGYGRSLGGKRGVGVFDECSMERYGEKGRRRRGERRCTTNRGLVEPMMGEPLKWPLLEVAPKFPS